MPTLAPCQPCRGRRPAVAIGHHPVGRAHGGAAQVLALQRSYGNAAVSRAIAGRRTLARVPARRRGEPIEQPGTGWDGLQGERVSRDLTEPMKEEVRRFRNQLEMSMKAGDQSKWGRWAAEDAAAFRGTASERAMLYAEFQRQMIQVDRSWVAKVVLGSDGSHVFLSSDQLKRTLVVAPDGSLHAGKWDALTETPDGRITVDYGKLHPTTPRVATPPVGPPASDPPATAKQPATQEPPRATPAAEPPVVKPSTSATPGTTLTPDQVTDDFVRKLAAEQEALVVRSGRYVLIGRTLYAVMIVGGVAFLVHDIVQRGPVYALRDFGIAAVLAEYIGMRAGVGLGMAGLVIGLVFLPSDQGGESERQAKAALIDNLVESAFPGTLGDKVFVCYGDRCSGSHREILDHDTYGRVWPQVAAAVEHPFELDDSPRAKAVIAERKKDAERAQAREREHEQEMAAIRQAMHPPVGFYVKGSVGDGGRNDPDDVRKTAQRLRELGFLEKETTDPDEVAEAIYVYQAAVLGWRNPDGRLDPRGATARALRAGRRISMALR